MQLPEPTWCSKSWIPLPSGFESLLWWFPSSDWFEQARQEQADVIKRLQPCSRLLEQVVDTCREAFQHQVAEEDGVWRVVNWWGRRTCRKGS